MKEVAIKTMGQIVLSVPCMIFQWEIICGAGRTICTIEHEKKIGL